MGPHLHAAAVNDLDAIRAAVTPATKAIWIETPTNPLLNVGDIAAISEIAHGAKAKLVVDNTFASPYLQQPLALGADVVLHSTTKYIGGHSDVVGGVLVTDDEELDAAFAFLQNGCRRRARPVRRLSDAARRQDARRTHGQALRQRRGDRRHARRPPGDRARCSTRGSTAIPATRSRTKQMTRFGGMISVRLKGGKQAALDMCARAELFTLAESLGGIESLIEHPGAMTHASTAGSLLEVPDDLVRLSVGIEDIADLIGDLETRAQLRRIGFLAWALQPLYVVLEVVVGLQASRDYSFASSTISDLGNTSCRTIRGDVLCSPWHDVMNAGFIWFGVTLALGALLLGSRILPGRIGYGGRRSLVHLRTRLDRRRSGAGQRERWAARPGRAAGLPGPTHRPAAHRHQPVGSTSRPGPAHPRRCGPLGRWRASVSLTVLMVDGSAALGGLERLALWPGYVWVGVIAAVTRTRVRTALAWTTGAAACAASSRASRP